MQLAGDKAPQKLHYLTKDELDAIVTEHVHNDDANMDAVIPENQGGQQELQQPQQEQPMDNTPKEEPVVETQQGTQAVGTSPLELEQPQVPQQPVGEAPVLSDEQDEFGHRFIVSSEGNTSFGEITDDTGLAAAPLKLSEGEDYVDERGVHHGYGLAHIEAERGEQIRASGYPSVQSFVETVGNNYTTIREGNVIAGNQTYLVELTDEHNNTLFVQLSRDGSFWNVNSAGIFRTRYSRNKREVFSRPAIGSSTNTDATGVNHGLTDGATVTSGNSPLTSTGKDSAASADVQGNGAENDEMPIGEDGEPNFAAVTPQRAHTFIYKDKGYSKDVANQLVNLKKKEADKRVGSLENKPPKFGDKGIGTSTAKYDAAMASWQQQLDEARRSAAYWQAVLDEEAKATGMDVFNDDEKFSKEMEQAVNELQGDREALSILADKAPQSLDEIAAAILTRGTKLMPNDEEVDGTLRRGALSHTGFKRADIKRMPFIFAGHAKGGVSLEQFAHMILEDARAEGIPFDESDANAGLDAAINLLASVERQGDITHYIERKRIGQALDQHSNMQRQIDEWEAQIKAEEEDRKALGMTENEYDAYISSYEERLAAQAEYENSQAYFDAMEEYWANFAQTHNIEENDRKTENDSGRGSETSLGEGERQDANTTAGTSTAVTGTEATDSGGLATGGEVVSVVEKSAGKPQATVTSSPEEIASEEAKVNTNPTDAQKEAGNYRKGHIKVDGFDVTIENPKGSVRSGEDADGHKWEQEMHNTYGYILGTEGVDGDHIDVFLSDDPTTGNVFVIDQVNKDGSFDEHKVMYGFGSAEEAREAYLSNYEEGWQGLGAITEVSREEFKKWVESSHRKTKPFAEYKSVKTVGDVVLGEGAAVSQQHTEQGGVAGGNFPAVGTAEEMEAFSVNVDGGVEALKYQEGETLKEYINRTGNQYAAKWYLMQKYADKWDEIADILNALDDKNGLETGRAIARIAEDKEDAMGLYDLLPTKPVLSIQPYIDGVFDGIKEAKREATAKQSTEQIGGMSDEQADGFLSQMQEQAEVAVEVPLTPENWISMFGKDGKVASPIGEVVMGENQYFKLAQQGREGKLGMVKPTLENPDAIIEEERPAKDGKQERSTSYIFIKTFTKEDGSRYYYFTSVTVSKEGREVVISNQEKSINRISRLLQEGNVVWTNPKFSSHPNTRIGESVPVNDSNKPTITDNQPALLGVNSSELSKGKGRDSSGTDKGNKDKSEQEPTNDELYDQYYSEAESEIADIENQLDSHSSAKNDELVGRITEMYGAVEDILEAGGTVDDVRMMARHDAAEKWMEDNLWGSGAAEPVHVYRSKDGKQVAYQSLLFDPLTLEPTQPAGETAGTTAGTTTDLTTLQLRPLKKGETSYIERRYVENKMFDFTGSEHIESADDVAYIFRQLENAAVENTFLVLVKDGRPTIIHLAMGSYTAAMAPLGEALVAYREINPDKVYMVHNHPSGNLTASRQDKQLLLSTIRAFGADKVQQGIIIDTTSGKYGEFYADGEPSQEGAMPSEQKDAVPLKVYNFGKQVFKEGWNPEIAFHALSSAGLASFISSHRLGEHKKMSLLVLNNQGRVVGNIFLPWTSTDDIMDRNAKGGQLVEAVKRLDEATNMIASYIHQMGGVQGVLYGNADFDNNVVGMLAERVRRHEVRLVDVLHMMEGGDYRSAAEQGLVRENDAPQEQRVGDTPKMTAAEKKRENKLRDAVVKLLRAAGIEVSTDWKAGQQVLDEVNGRATLSRGQKRALETVVPSDKSPFKATVVSSADGAKVVKSLETLAEKSKNIASSGKKTFLNDVAEAIGAKKKGSNSQYATFETRNGRVVTIRLADHNVSTSTFDNNDEDAGISVVVSRKPNEGINNDGVAHVVEYFYHDKVLRNADDAAYSQIVRSIQQALYSGEYKDTTGLAEREEVNAPVREMRVFHGSGAEFNNFDSRFMSTGEGNQSYGWGHYTTSVPGIGQMYAEAMKDKKEPATYKGINALAIQYLSKDFFNTIGVKDEMQRDILADIVRSLNYGYGDPVRMIRVKRESIEDAIKKNQRLIQNSKEAIKYAKGEEKERLAKRLGVQQRALGRNQARIDFINSLDPKDFKGWGAEKSGYLYSVDIPEDNGSNYFDWTENVPADRVDAILSDLRERLLADDKYGWNADEASVERLDKRLDAMKQMFGETFYGRMAVMLGNSAAGARTTGRRLASELLSRHGYVGIKYPAEYRTGGREDGAKNYVVFNDADLKIADKVKFFRTATGEAYGFTVGGKIYLDPRVATAETPIHEYVHLWAEALRKANPQAWEQLKEQLLGQKDVLDYVKSLYPELEGDELMEEVFAHFAGKRGAERLRTEQERLLGENKDGAFGVARIVYMLDTIRRALQSFWQAARDLFAGSNAKLKEQSAEDFADMAMNDLLNGVKPMAASNEDMKARDKAYMEALEKGDLETAQRLVDEAAQAAGYTVKAYHGTRSNVFTVFDKSRIGQNYGGYNAAGGGFDFTSTEHWAEAWGAKAKTGGKTRVIPVYLKSQKPFYSYYGKVPSELEELLPASMSKKERIRAMELGVNFHEALDRNGIDFKSAIQRFGYDSYLMDPNAENIAVYDPNQIKSADPVTYDDKGDVIPLSERFNPDKVDIRWQKAGESIEAVNSRFNEELQQQIAGTLPKGHVYDIGMPSDILLSTGIANVPMQLSASRLEAKSSKFGHDFDLSEIKDLVKAIHEPVAVFSYGDKGKAQNIIVEIQHEGKNFVVGLSIRPTVGGRVLEINSIRNVFPKKNAEWLNWINQGKLLYVDKEKIQALIDQQRTVLADVEYLDLNSAAKVVESFVNPNNTEENLRFREGDAPVFLSNAQRAVEGIKQEKATPEQWLKMIEKAGGLKAGEDKWMGLSEWLKGSDAKTLTKQEVQEFIRSNQIQVEEVKYEEEPPFGETLERKLFQLTNSLTNEAIKQSKIDGISLPEASEKLLNERYGDQWKEYLTLDRLGFIRMDEYASQEEAAEFFDIDYDKNAVRQINSTRLDYTTEGLENKREIALVVPTVEPWNESDDIHFGDAGGGRAVAWVRFGDAELNEEGELVYNNHDDFILAMQRKYGKEGRVLYDAMTPEEQQTEDALLNGTYQKPKNTKRVLVIDEIQSKRHQEGRERGYKGAFDAAAFEKARKEVSDYGNYLYEKYIKGQHPGEDYLDYASEEEKAHFHELVRKRAEIENLKRNGIPDAPFDKNWHELAMKRMLRLAAEEGYDKIAWTKGEQQAERYNIGKVVDAIEARPYKAQSASESDGHDLFVHQTDGTMWEMFVQPDGTLNSDSQLFDGKNVTEVFGKDIARKISETTQGVLRLDGESLRVGADGMKGFYDQILPRFMDKYGKKWGVKTGEVELPLEDGSLTMWAVDVTDEMRDSVMQGQTMFREVTDGELLDWLEKQPKVKVYRSMVLIDGKLYPPMSSKIDGRLRQPSELGKWEEAEEAPDKAKQAKNGKWYFDLKKDNNKGVDGVAYNPYIHTSSTMLNDQFSEAQSRDNLVVVEMEVPVSELMSGYKAEKAHDSTGVKQWKAGPIQGLLTGKREVILTRWAKPVRIVPVDEVADHIADMLDGQVEVMPTNVVTPQQREALEKRGVKFVETNNKGELVEGKDAGKTWASVYGKKSKGGKRTNKAKQWHDAFIERLLARLRGTAEDAVKKLHLEDKVTILETPEGLTGRKAKSKGWFDVNTGKIVIVLSNHFGQGDVIRTVIHEGVAHYGLRQLFGEHFDQFLDNVFAQVTPDIRAEIVELSKKHGWDFREATEEYLASLAERTDFNNNGWWAKVKQLFLEMLDKLGLRNFGGVELTDNELRYVLWASYENLKEPGRFRNPFGLAEDISKQMELKVGDFAERPAGTEEQEMARVVAAESKVRHRLGDWIGDYVYGLTYDYNLQGTAMTVCVEGVEDLEGLEGLIGEDAYKKVVDEYNTKGVTGCYVRANDLVVVFTGKVRDDEEGELAWWHEQAHHVTDLLGLDEYGDDALAWLQATNPGLYDFITSHYSQGNWGREAIAYWWENMVKDNGGRNLLDADFSGNERLSTLARQIQGGVKYGKQQEKAGNRRGQAIQGKPSLSSYNIQFDDGGGKRGNTSESRRAGLWNNNGDRVVDSGVDSHRSRISPQDKITARDLYERMMSSGASSLLLVGLISSIALTELQ